MLSEKSRSGKGDGEGSTPPEDTNGRLASHQIADYPVNEKEFSDDPEIDTVVHQLYDIYTRDPGIEVQIQIDRYLFAASSELVTECGGDARMCVLMESQVPCLFNLPDLVYILRHRLTWGSWANALQETVCRYTIPGMQKSRWVTRKRKPSASESAAQTTDVTETKPTAASGKVDGSLGLRNCTNETPLTGVYINTLMGLLLGLYPQCSKRPGFNMRVRILRAVRVLLTSSTQVQTEFILKHVSLIRLAMVEYFANVLELYCPVEYQLLQRHIDIKAYVNLCRSSCDLFRVNNLSGNIQKQKTHTSLDWTLLDSMAYKMTDKIIRSTRVEAKLINYIEVHHKSIKKLVSSDIYKQPALCDEFLSIVKDCAVACCQDDHSYLYQKMLSDKSVSTGQVTGQVTGRSVQDSPRRSHDSVTDLSGSDSAREMIRNSTLDLNLVVSDIHSVIQATMLPANFVLEQIRTLQRLYKFDPIQLLVACKKRICLHCVLRIAPKQFALEELINGNVRMHLDTDDILCNRCMSCAHMISIDLIGRVLRINQQYLYICAFCGGVHQWRADGCDLLRCPNQPKESLRLRALLHDETRDTKMTNTGYRKCRTHCFVCAKLCTGNGLWLLHVAAMKMVHFDLCSTHLPPMHMLQYIVDTGDYKRWLTNADTRARGQSRKKRKH